MKICTLVGALLGAFAVAGGLFFAGGGYDFAADRPHWPLTARLIESARERAIAVRSADLVVPALDAPELIEAGAEHYAAMCTTCHLEPGLSNSELRIGLYPQPPDLTRSGHEHGAANEEQSARRRFWIIKHGLKLTAMPAWGATHRDIDIWGLVAFLQRLPALSVDEYRALVRTAGDGDHGHATDGVDQKRSRPDVVVHGHPDSGEESPLHERGAHAH